ncbi:unnamed protein product [Hapterophycus canaliculatus]
MDLAAGGATTAPASGGAAAGIDSSPARKLRLTRPRSPVSSSPAASLTEASPPTEAVGGRVQVAGAFGKEVGAGSASRGTRRTNRLEKDDRTERPLEDLSGNVTTKRALPRLRAEEAERRRAPRSKPRAARAPINLGGMVSGIKHTLLARRRSTGDGGTPVAASASSQTTPRSMSTSGQGSGGSGSNDRLSVSAIATNKENNVLSTPAAAAAAPTPDPEQLHKKKRGSRRTIRAGDTSSSRSSSEPPSALNSVAADGVSAATTATAATAVKKRQRGRDGFGGGRKEGQGGKGTRDEGATAVHVVSEVVAAKGGDVAVLATLPGTGSSGTAGAEAETRGPPMAAPTPTPSATAEVGVVPAPVAVAVEEGNGDTADTSPRYGRWPATLDARWAEVEFMLCHEVDCEESLQYTIQATDAGLVFMEKLEEKARELGVLKGQLSRWLLPFNADTSVEEQQAATPRRFQESLLALSVDSGAATGGGDGGSGGGGLLTEEEAEYLTTGARRVRQLVRVKIADDNDLNTAKEALATMAGFFSSISEEAAKRGGSATAFSVLQERRAVSPLTRPPPLPSIPRPSSAMNKESTTQRAKGFHDVTPSTDKQTSARDASDSGARRKSVALSPTTEPASTGKATVPTRQQEGGQNNDDRKSRIESDVSCEGGCDTLFSTGEASTTPTDRVDGEVAVASHAGANHAGEKELLVAGATTTAAAAMVASAEPNKPGKLLSIPRGDSQDRTAATATRTTGSIPTATVILPPSASSPNASEISGKRGVAAGSRLGHVGGATATPRSTRDRSSSFKGAVPTATSSVRGGKEQAAEASPSSNVQAGHSPRSGTSGEGNGKVEVAPAESLVRLKRRRQPSQR